MFFSSARKDHSQVVHVVYTTLGFVIVYCSTIFDLRTPSVVAVWYIVDKCTTALPLDGAYDTMIRFSENPNTEDFQVLHRLVAFLGESLPCFAQSSKHMNYYIRITEISIFFFKSVIHSTLGWLQLFLIKTMDNTLKNWG